MWPQREFIYWLGRVPSSFRSYTVILPKKSELSSNTILTEDTPPSSSSGWVGTKSKICRRFTSSGYIWDRTSQAVFESVPGMQTAHRVPTKPPWKTIESRLGIMRLGKSSWINWGNPCMKYQLERVRCTNGTEGPVEMPSMSPDCCR